MQSYFAVVVAAFAVWRVTHLLTQESGPADLLAILRMMAGNGMWGQLFNCFYCMSLWVAAAVTPFLAQGWKEWLLLWPALSGAAILLERMGTERPPARHGFYIEETENEHVLRETNVANIESGRSPTRGNAP